MSVSVDFGRGLIQGGEERRKPPLAARLIGACSLDGVADGDELPVQPRRQRPRQVKFGHPPACLG
jgi:hypothetical protein